MKFELCVLTLIFLGAVQNVESRSEKITDCESIDSYVTLKLYCGRSPVQKSTCTHYYYHRCQSYTHFTCYNDVFSNGKASDVLRLEIGDCRANELSSLFSDRFNNLEKLDISNYGLDIMQSNALQFEKLDTLIASHNNLTKISSLLFDSAPVISDIDFSYNRIAEIDANAFKNAANLTRILLAHNRISALEQTIFSELIDLETLDLSSNSIQTLEKDLFKFNENLQTLRLEENPIRRFDENIFMPLHQLPSLQVYASCGHVREMDSSSFGPSMSLDVDDSTDNIVFSSQINDSAMNCSEFKWSELQYLNISGNQLDEAEMILSLLGSSLDVLDLSFNRIWQLSSSTMAKLKNLKYLDVRNTGLSTVDFRPSVVGPNLKTLRLEHNPIGRADCTIFSLLLSTISFNISWENVHEIDTSCLHDAIEIIASNDTTEAVFRGRPAHAELRCLKSRFHQFTSFDVSTNQLPNILSVLDLLGPALETLDVSYNHVGNLTSHTFQRFTNLKYLNLSHTELSNFQFATFYHQRRLRMLDVSYNRLSSVNFTLFLRIFKDLKTLSVEGNDLTEINSITRTIFPKLSTLGISKNRFSCDYLATFLSQWDHHLNLVDNPSNHTHIDGIDCHHANDNREQLRPSETPTKRNHTEHLSTDIKTMKYIMLCMLALLCIYLIVRFKPIQHIWQKMNHKTPNANSLELQ